MPGTPSRRNPVSEDGRVDQDQDTWNRIIGLSKDMLTLARDAQWQAVSGLEAERNGLIRQYFSATHPRERWTRIRPMVDELLSMDKEIEGLCRKGQDDLARDLKSLRRGKIAARAYTG